jgi:hypothetical protein
MSALNTKETEDLRAVKSVLENILKYGYDPKAEDPRNKLYGSTIEKAVKAVKTVVQMKGYYPS